MESGLYEVDSTLKIVLPFEVQQNSVYINGLEETTATAEAGKFTVTVTTAATPSTEITIFTGDAAIGDTVRVFYRRRINASSHFEIRTDTTAARGELWAHYPLYSSGTDCTDAARKGSLHIFIPRARATTLPGIESSYKSAQTYSVTFSAIDPKRPDLKMYSIFYEPYDAEGNINTTPGSGDAQWGVSG